MRWTDRNAPRQIGGVAGEWMAVAAVLTAVGLAANALTPDAVPVRAGPAPDPVARPAPPPGVDTVAFR